MRTLTVYVQEIVGGKLQKKAKGIPPITFVKYVEQKGNVPVIQKNNYTIVDDAGMKKLFDDWRNLPRSYSK